jgi:hypothetical protein
MTGHSDSKSRSCEAAWSGCLGPTCAFF